MSRYVEERRATFGVEPICRVLGVPVSTYYARRSRKPSRRTLEDAWLLGEIHTARAGYRSAYGARKTWKELKRRGVEVGRDRVARLIRREGLEGIRRGTKQRTTIADEAALERARDLLQRDFSATHPNEKWVADITYIRTWSGFCYLAFVLDCYSRMIVDWQLASHMRAELVLDALEMANGLRRPECGLIAHSDRGSQYTSLAYTDRLDELGVAPSVGSRGDAYDNAMAEAFVATFKSELVDGRRFRSYEQLEHDTLHWIGFYNEERLHEELGDVPPAEYELISSRRHDRDPVNLLTEPLRNPGSFITSLGRPEAPYAKPRPRGSPSGHPGYVIDFYASPERTFTLEDDDARRVSSALRQVHGQRRSIALDLAYRIDFQLVIPEDRRRYISIRTHDERDVLADGMELAGP